MTEVFFTASSRRAVGGGSAAASAGGHSDRPHRRDPDRWLQASDSPLIELDFSSCIDEGRKSFCELILALR